jgi:hypothetical protein
MLAILCLSHVEAATPSGTIAFIRDADIYTVKLDGTNLHRLTSDSRNAFPIWSPNGQTIAFSKLSISRNGEESANLWIISSDGRHARRITPDKRLNAVYPVAWLPDMTGLLVSRHYLESDAYPTLDVVMLNGKPSRHLRRWMRTGRKHGFLHQFPNKSIFTMGSAGSFTQNGDLVFTASTTCFTDAPRLDLYKMHADGSSLHRLTMESRWFIDCLRISPVNGMMLTSDSSVAERLQPSIKLRDSHGRILKELSAIGQSSYGGIDWSPDGNYVIYQTTDSRYPRYEQSAQFEEFSRHSSIWIMNPDGSRKKKIVSNACHPNWRK